MQININQTNFLIDLFDKYREKLYMRMRKGSYRIDDIVNFMNGYSVVIDYCYRYSIDTVMGNGYDPVSNFKTVLFNDKESMIAALNKIVDDVKAVCVDCNEWEKIGIKYAICFAKCYIEHVLFGDHVDVETDDLPYLSIPDKDDPESYDWEERDFHYNI